METLKQFLAFPMYLTALWLFWVLGKQTGVDGMTQAVAGALALAFALWLLGRPSTRLFARVLRGTAIVGALLLCVLALSTLRMEFATGDTPHGDAWEPYSAERLATLRAEGQPVLVNMTAAWCITCLANERVAIATTEVAEAMQTHGIVYLKGDWTRRDAAITAYLAQFGRNGVPLYVVYPRGGAAPRVLPQVLTASLVAQALEDAARGTAVASSPP
jgi:thiol:disulfide interchange protein DsbD